MRNPLVLALAIAAPVAAAPQAPSDTLALVGVHIVTLAAVDSVLHDQTLLIADGRIVAVGPRQVVPVPATARRPEVTGRFVMPGLVDAHVHLEYFDDPAILRAFLRYGVTTVRNLDGRPHILAWRTQVARGELLGPRIVTAGPILDGAPPLREDNLSIGTAEEARRAVLEQHAAGYDFIKVYSRLSSSAYQAAVETARALQLPVAGHLPREVPLAAALAARQFSIEHLTDFDAVIEATDSPTRGRFHWSRLHLGIAADSARMAEAAGAVRDAGTWVVPTLLAQARSVASDAEVRRVLADPAMAVLPRDAAARWQQIHAQTTARIGPEDAPIIARGRANRAALVRALHRAGAGLAAGTDTPNPFVIPGVSLLEELAALVDAGLSPREALAVAIRGGAGIVGCPDSCGRIASGHEASIVVLSADPQADLSQLRHPIGVVVAGRWLPIQALAMP